MKMQTGAALRTLKTMLALGAILFTFGAFALTFQALARGVVPSPVNVMPPESAADTLIRSMGLPADSEVGVGVSQMDTLTAAMVTFPVVIVCGLLAAIFAQLSAMLGEADAGRPFARQNVRRLHRVARLTLLAAVVGWWLGPALQAWAQIRLGSDGVAVSMSWTPIVVAMGAYALVGIWQRGAELADFEEHVV